MALEWARYLVDAFGTTGAVWALQYYEDVGWISPSVRRTMTGHLDSLSPGDAGEPDASGGPADLPGALASLEGSPFEAHARSLAYVATIADDSLPGRPPSVRPRSTEADAGATDPTGAAPAPSERVGVAGSVETAGTFHLLAEDGRRSRCGMLDDDSETAHDVAEVLPRDDAAEAGLSLCGNCRERSGE